MSAGVVPQRVAGPGRTAVQGSLAFAVTELVDSFGILAMDERQYAAVLLALTLLFGFVQTVVEDATGRGFLRRVPTPPQPVVDDGGPV